MITKEEYLRLKELIDTECNRAIIKPEYKEPIIFLHRNLKERLKQYFKYFKT